MSLRGCGLPRRSGPSVASADPSDPIEHHGCTRARFMSFSSWWAYTAGTDPSSSMSRSKRISSGSGGGFFPCDRMAITPDGQQIWHKGVEPDVSVDLAADADPLRPVDDRQINLDDFDRSHDEQLKDAFDEVTTGDSAVSP